MYNDPKEIFPELKKLFKKYNPPLMARADDASHYDLWYTKAVEIAGRKRDDLHFAGMTSQSKNVDSYYMPFYVDMGMKKNRKKNYSPCSKERPVFKLHNGTKRMPARCGKI
jgi:hypothetical protein